MLDSKSNKLKREKIGFSTGALEKGNFRKALQWMSDNKVRSVELSALRLEELEPLVNSLDSIQLNRFDYVSFHAPSFFPKEAERHVVLLLKKIANRGWNIIVHPDVIRKPALWRQFNSHLLIENMDRRKSIGRTVDELKRTFDVLPNARLCLDLAHARQLDTTLNLLSHLVMSFSNRIGQIHISELDSWCQHQPMSSGAVSDYQRLAKKINSTLPVIIESMLDEDRTNLRMSEFYLAHFAMYACKRNGLADNWKKTFLKKKSHKYFFESFNFAHCVPHNHALRKPLQKRLR